MVMEGKTEGQGNTVTSHWSGANGDGDEGEEGGEEGEEEGKRCKKM